MTDNRLPDADSRSSARTTPTGPEDDSGPGSRVGDGASGASDGLAAITLQLVEELFGSLPRLTEIYGDRVRLRIRRSIVRVALGAMAAVCVVIWLGAATLTTLRGLCGGIAALSGRPWFGDLAGGALALLFAAGAVALGTRIVERRDLRRLEAKYASHANERDHGSDDAPAENA